MKFKAMNPIINDIMIFIGIMFIAPSEFLGVAFDIKYDGTKVDKAANIGNINNGSG